MRDSWNGFDSNPSPYSEKEDRRYEAKIWWLLIVIALGAFISIFFRVISDNKKAASADVIVAEYQMISGKEMIVYVDGGGTTRYIQGVADRIKEKNGKPLVFDTKGEGNYVTMASALSWWPYFLFFGLMSAGCGYKLYRIYLYKRPTYYTCENKK